MMSVIYSTCLPFIQPIHTLLHLPVYISACMNGFMLSWHLWVIWYAQMLLWMSVWPANQMSVKCFFIQQIHSSYCFWFHHPVSINDRASHLLPPAKQVNSFITPWWQTQRKKEDTEAVGEENRRPDRGCVIALQEENWETVIKSKERSVKGSER